MAPAAGSAVPPGPTAASPAYPAASAPPQDPNAGGGNPEIAVSQGYGLCQCIGNPRDNTLAFTCPGSAQACASSCGTNYSFKPDALCRRSTNP
jgi:hypothetical protein